MFHGPFVCMRAFCVIMDAVYDFKTAMRYLEGRQFTLIVSQAILLCFTEWSVHQNSCCTE